MIADLHHVFPFTETLVALVFDTLWRSVSLWIRKKNREFWLACQELNILCCSSGQ